MTGSVLGPFRLHALTRTEMEPLSFKRGSWSGLHACLWCLPFTVAVWMVGISCRMLCTGFSAQRLSISPLRAPSFFICMHTREKLSPSFRCGLSCHVCPQVDSWALCSTGHYRRGPSSPLEVCAI